MCNLFRCSVGSNCWTNLVSCLRCQLLALSRNRQESDHWSRGGESRGKVEGLANAIQAGLARAESLPEDTVDLLLGAVVDSDGTRGVANLDIRIAQNVTAFATGEFAGKDDWAAVTGLKLRG